MYTTESNYKEMVSIAKELGLETKSIKKADLIEALNAAATVQEEAPVEVVEETRGRKVNPNSARQIRLAEMAARAVDGVIKRGRPSDPTSAWNIKQAALEAKRGEDGKITLGRQINPDSARQKRLALKGTLPLGRPKAVVEEIIEEVIVEVPTEETSVE